MSFSYLIDKVQAAPFDNDPFQHVYIRDFLAPDHFEEIIRSTEIATPPYRSDEEMFEGLFALGYKVIDFPGCITDYREYIRWHADRHGRELRNNSSCEGFGVTLRLMALRSPLVKELATFLEGDEFKLALAAKFGIEAQAVLYDAGIQKYLDGYEISPHPDTRKKALTYMVNINPRSDSESCDHHTHYLRFKAARRYVQTLWENNPQIDRCWVPWDWCESIKTQPENNSIVIFAPTDETIHAVKASYDHLLGQRTQLYCNLWYREFAFDAKPEWEDLDFIRPRPVSDPEPLAGVKTIARRIASKLFPADTNIVSNRRAGK